MQPGFASLVTQASVTGVTDTACRQLSQGLQNRFGASSNGDLADSKQRGASFVPTQRQSLSPELVPSGSLKPCLCLRTGI